MKPTEFLNESEIIVEGKIRDLLTALRIQLFGMNNAEKNYNIVMNGIESGEIDEIVSNALKMEGYFYAPQRKYLRSYLLTVKRSLAELKNNPGDFRAGVAHAERLTIALNDLRKLIISLRKDPKKNVMKKPPKVSEDRLLRCHLRSRLGLIHLKKSGKRCLTLTTSLLLLREAAISS